MRAARRGLFFRRCIAAAAGAIALAARTAPARAEPGDPIASLEWGAPAGCPSKDDVLRDVARALGSSFQPGATPLSARVLIVRSESGDGAGAWRATVLLRAPGDSSPRTLEGPSCASVASAVALVLAVSAQTTAAASRASEPKPPAAPPAARRHFRASVLAAVTAGGAPSALGGGFLGFGWEGRLGPGQARIEVDAGLWATQSVRLPGDAGEGASFAMQTFGLSAGYGWTWGHASIGPVLGVELQRLAGSGFSSAGPAFADDVLYAALRAGLSASWTIAGPLALRAIGEAVLPIAPPELVVEAPDSRATLPLYSPGIGARGMLGLDVRFP